MIIHQLTNHGTINEIHHSQVYITPQGMTHLPHPATDAKDATDVAEVTDVTEVTASEETTEQRHARCLRTLFTLTTAKGTPLFTFSSQWTAVYRILVDYHGYPTEYRSFHLRMQQLGADSLTPACTYDALKDISGIFSKPFTQWKEENYTGQGAVFRRNYEVAAELKRLLEE